MDSLVKTQFHRQAFTLSSFSLIAAVFPHITLLSHAFNLCLAVSSHYTINLNAFPSSLFCKALKCVLKTAINVKFTVIQVLLLK